MLAAGSKCSNVPSVGEYSSFKLPHFFTFAAFTGQKPLRLEEVMQGHGLEEAGEVGDAGQPGACLQQLSCCNDCLYNLSHGLFPIY